MILIKIIREILRIFGLWKPADRDSSEDTAVDIATTQAEVATLNYPYRRRDDFLSAAERNFFHVLYSIVGHNYLVCAKVNLADLFYVPSRDSNEYRTYTNKIDRKHVDYVLCDPQTLIPRLGIELDDSSHNRADRQQRDYFVDNVFAAAGLPLLRVKVQRSYAINELEIALFPYLDKLESQSVHDQEVSNLAQATENSTSTWPTTSEINTETTPPTCPKCGDKMVLRTGRIGANAGQHFWGCSNYPRCKSMLAYSAAPAPV